jgi:hypothetical protein
MTFSSPWQFSVFSVKELFEHCKNSDFIDCRINAYAEYTEYKGIIRQPPNFIFIDLDLTHFELDRKKLDLGLKKTLKKIEEYDGLPTVLWTGNGYHIYLPVNAMVLDHESIFSRDRFPSLFSSIGKYSNWSISELFLKYAEIFFTNGKADPQHKPKYKTCLIRIPGSYNSKLLNKGFGKEDSQVKVIQRWNRANIPIQKLLRNFRAWITEEEYEQTLIKRKTKWIGDLPKRKVDNIEWIEKLLRTPLEDYRKYCLWSILCPYLINVKCQDRNEAMDILNEWLLKCDEIKKLDFNHSFTLKANLNGVRSYWPPKVETLRNDQQSLYQFLKSKYIIK